MDNVVSDRVRTIACSPYSSNGDRGELAAVCSRVNAELALVAGTLRYIECGISYVIYAIT